MNRYWVKYVAGGKTVSKAMDGESPRHLAVEIRERHRDVVIEAIRPLAGGTRRRR